MKLHASDCAKWLYIFDESSNRRTTTLPTASVPRARSAPFNLWLLQTYHVRTNTTDLDGYVVSCRSVPSLRCFCPHTRIPCSFMNSRIQPKRHCKLFTIPSDGREPRRMTLRRMRVIVRLTSAPYTANIHSLLAWHLADLELSGRHLTFAAVLA